MIYTIINRIISDEELKLNPRAHTFLGVSMKIKTTIKKNIDQLLLQASHFHIRRMSLASS